MNSLNFAADLAICASGKQCSTLMAGAVLFAGLQFRVANAPPALAIDAAHIQWHQARGALNTVNNGLALCALHHRLFDDGVFTLSLVPNLIVEVAPSATGWGFNESLGCFHGQSPRILPPDGVRPDHRFLLWHRKEVFRSYKANE